MSTSCPPPNEERSGTAGRAMAAVLLVFGGLLIGGAIGFARGVRETRRIAAAARADRPPGSLGAVLAVDAALGACAGGVALAVPAVVLLRANRAGAGKQ